MFQHIWKYFIAAAIVLCGVFLTFHQTEEKPTNTIIVGLQSGYPPFEFRDAENKIIGFDVDLANLISKKLGKDLVIQDMEFEGEILSLKHGKIDLIISGMDITTSRKKEIVMVPYHGDTTTHFSLIFWKEIPENVHSLEDLADLPNAIVCVETGTTPEAFLKNFPAIQSRSLQGSLAPFMDVKFGKSVANLVSEEVAAFLQKQNPDSKILRVPIPEEYQVFGVGIGIKKENIQLIEQISQIIQELKANGEIKKLEEKWLQGGKNG